MILPETIKDYYLIVNQKELETRASELGYDNVITVDNDGLNEDDI